MNSFEFLNFNYFIHKLSISIGLVRTIINMFLSASVTPIPVASAVLGGGVNAGSTGWGNRPNLHVLVSTSLTNADCQSRLPGWSHFVYADQTLCMLATAGNMICDTGNPLEAAGQIVGIQSWQPVCDSAFPSMHMRINHFRAWILATAV